MSGAAGAHPDAAAPPPWYRTALAEPPQLGAVEVDGCEIRYRTWGDPGHRGVVLVHGGAAHARWWDHLAPLIASNRRVVALDLSGHGDSGRRHDYHPETWAEEVRVVAEAAVPAPRPVLVGHSMGGFVTMVSAATYGDRLAGVVVVDSPVRRPDPESEEGRRGRMFRSPKTYASLDEAVEHFHLVPPQPVVLPWLVRDVARHSLAETDEGWTWKFDPRIFGRFPHRRFDEYLGDAACRVAVFHGEHSHIVTADVTDYMHEVLGRNAPFVEIPAAHHHLILDQPLAFVAALRAILADWQHSTPHRLGNGDAPGQ